MTSRNDFRAPGIWNMDLGIYKDLYLHETGKVAACGEFYNLFNHLTTPKCTSRARTPTFSPTAFIPACKGSTGTYTDCRNLQLAAKLLF
jgi:hypothetical protein